MLMQGYEDANDVFHLQTHVKHQHFFSFPYRAATWEDEQMCHCKVESTGKGLNIRYIISNFE